MGGHNSDFNDRSVELLSTMHSWLADPDVHFVFLTDADGTLMTLPEVGPEGTFIDDSHKAPEAIAKHQVGYHALHRKRPTGIHETLLTIRARRAGFRSTYGIITASGIDRFIDEPTLRLFLAKYPQLDTEPPSVYHYLHGESHAPSTPYRFAGAFDFVNASFGQVEVDYRSGQPHAYLVGEEIHQQAMADRAQRFIETLSEREIAERMATAAVAGGAFYFGDSVLAQESDGFGDISDTNERFQRYVQLFMRHIEPRPFSRLIHHLDPDSECFTVASGIFSQFRSRSDLLLDLVASKDVVGLNLMPPDGSMPSKADAYDSLEARELVPSSGRRLILYCGDTGSDIKLMDHLQRKFRNDPEVMVICIGVGDAADFTMSADFVVNSIDHLTSFVDSISKAGLPDGSRGDFGQDRMFNPMIASIAAPTTHVSRAKQLARVGIEITEVGRMKLDSTKARVHPPCLGSPLIPPPQLLDESGALLRF